MQNDTKAALGFGALIVALLFATAFVSGKRSQQADVSGSGITLENGVQVIDISVKGGYSPSKIVAKAGVPTELRFTTKGTYDCSSIVAIPSIGFQETLPATGTEMVTLSADQAAGTLQGQCGMGMYHFEVAFR